MARGLAYEPQNALNAICPYFTMFPLEYPMRVLQKHKAAKAKVVDPFCGRGTTLFAARSLRLASVGVDASPVAVAIAQAKLCQIEQASILDLARSFIDAIIPSDIPNSDFFTGAYHPEVLRKICAIREGLLTLEKHTEASIMLRAAMLGCLHGPMSKKPENQAYFSNQMPRTFSSKPEYSVKFWQQKQLTAPNLDVIAVLQRKLERIPSSPLPASVSFNDVCLGDARSPDSITKDALDFSVVVTSPPYYGMRTYVEDQWLRNWFVGGPDHVTYGNANQLQHTGKAVFAESLGQVWANMARSTADSLHMYVRFGIIPSAKTDARELMLNSLEASTIPWRVVSVRNAQTAHSGKRQAAQMAAASTAAVEYDFHLVRQ
ncbi:DNA methyltransferase [Hymenobacter sp. CRA2]|uniref:DNA methyltransferase n=1 Tax=Hymenobacter sp. CRA2 TaxID=1955620 RepID=UPI00098E98D2|nr:class I SAM-dependent methyltransferase [Hymenobacter sp. CRA2]OON65496.1 site-specific DNA-methyltransferase [Hymenobacter sp. CRA2]